VLLALPVAVVAASTIHIISVRDDDAGLRLAYAMGFVALEVLGLIAALYAALRRGEDRALKRAWLLLALSFVTMFAFGAALGAAAAGAAPGVVTAVLLATRVVQTFALLGMLLSFPTRTRSRRDRAKLGFELATALGGGFMIVWYFVVSPALASPSAALTTVLFPVSELMVMFGICAVLLRGAAPAMRRPLGTLLAGLTLMFGSELYSSHRVVYEPGHVARPAATIVALAGLGLIIIAVGLHCRRPPGPAAAVSGPPAEPTTSHLPYIALAIGYGVLALAAARDGLHPWLGLVAGAILMTGGVAARQIIALRENHELAVTDGLTGLANRAQLHLRFRRAIDRCRRGGHEVGVLVIDLDGFKVVNDTNGHEAGDRLLTAFAGALRRGVRATDVAGRLGGDEFAVVLERVGVADAIGVADRVLAAAASCPVPIGGAEISAKVSIGIAVAPAADVDQHELMHRADLAMYQAKREGRHGWELYTEALDSGAPSTRDLTAAI
jgi:diguanylate cyclase (GGDEF)-like protein